jgi:TfoX/Sxy family transcriptional regulator of competence genes
LAYNEELASRVREILAEIGDVAERKMFGGIAFMVSGHMCCGVINDDLVLRLGPEAAQKALKHPHVRPMDFTGRPMKDMSMYPKTQCERKSSSATGSARHWNSSRRCLQEEGLEQRSLP